jgi:hypothetical protein
VKSYSITFALLTQRDIFKRLSIDQASKGNQQPQYFLVFARISYIFILEPIHTYSQNPSVLDQSDSIIPLTFLQLFHITHP